MLRRHPSAVKGVRGHTTWSTIATAMVRQKRNTIMPRLRTTSLLARAFARTKIAMSALNAISKENAM